MDHYTLGEDKDGVYIKHHRDVSWWKGPRKQYFLSTDLALSYLNDAHTTDAFQFALKWHEARTLPEILRKKLESGKTTWVQLEQLDSYPIQKESQRS